MDRERRMNGGVDYYMVDRSNGMVSSSSPLRDRGSDGCSVGVGDRGLNYIEHSVSKLDTLAGVAIRYGVEVADIKRMNGLVSDLQMFARKTLQIPLPGRHPPSPLVSDGQDTQGPSSSKQTPSRRHSDLFDSFQSLKWKSSPQPKFSPAMNCLQGYYGLRKTDQKAASEGFEMAVYRKGGSHYLEDGPFVKSSPPSNQPLGLHRKCKSVANGFMSEDGVVVEHSSQDTRDNGSDRWLEKLVRRRQKSETDFSSNTPEMLLKEDNCNSGGFSAIAGKGLALRPKSASRTLSGADTEASSITPIPIGLGDSFVNDVSVVRKSSSTSNLQDSDGGTLSSLWPTSKWNLKPDFQAISTAAITKPIFDGLPIPIAPRRNKAAID